MLLKKKDFIQFDDYVVDRLRWSIEWQGEPVNLNRKTFDLLMYLIDHRERVVPKEELLRSLWPDQFVEESNLTQHVFLLRKALSRQEPGRKIIETVPGRGYRFSATLIETPQVDDGVVFAATESGSAVEIDKPQDDKPPEIDVGAASHVNGFRPVATSDPQAPESTAALFEPPITPERASPILRTNSIRRYGVPALGMTAVVLALLLLYVRLTRPPAGLVVVDTRRLTNDGMPKSPDSYSTALISDGQRLYFTEVRDNQSAMAQVSIKGGDVQTQVGPFSNASVVDYSPRLHELLIGSTWTTKDDRPILAEPVPEGISAGSGLRQIGELTGHDANWSPTSDRIAFAKGRFLYVANADGSDVRTVASGDDVIAQPRWSPEGRSLRFTQIGVGLEAQIWEVNADGGNLHQVLTDTPDRNQASCGTWSADGRYFFYLGGHYGSTRDIWVLPTQRAPWPARPPRPVRLASGAVDEWLAPLSSADGRHVWAIGKILRGEVDQIDPKTRQATAFLGGISAEGVSFSPDGAWIAYTAYPEGTVWRSRPDGTEKLQLTSPPTIARFPRWSPDGRTIAFLGALPGLTWRLYLVSPAGGKAEALLEDNASEGVASWSPDGKEIAFGRLLNYGAQSDPNLSIEIVDVARRSSRTLHNSAGLWTPRWSPDGRYFTAITQDNQTLRLYDTRTREWSDLASVGVNDVIWSPDSQFVYFDTTFGDDSRIYRVEIAGRKLEQWANLSGFHRGGFFGPWLGMSPDGSPILLRDTSIQEVYQLSLEPKQ